MPAAASPRLAALDFARGAAIVAMAVYHLVWDLAFFRYLAPETPFEQPFLGLARATASSFLVLVGASLVLATRNGFRPRPFLRRLAIVAAAAAAITLATWLATPEGYVRFGILHLIAAASVIALPFLALPPIVTAAAALAAFALGLYFAGDPAIPLWMLPVIAPAMPPQMSDYTPLLPWVSAVLAGIAVAKAALQAGLDRRLARFAFTGPVGRLLRFGGRHSLAVYLLHQPVLIGLVFLASLALPPASRDLEAAFVRTCAASCAGRGEAASACRAARARMLAALERC